MKKTLKSLLSFLIMIMILLNICIPSTPAFSATMPTSGECGDTLDWSFNEQSGVLKIIGNYDMWASSKDAFSSFSSQVKAIELPEGLRKISKYAFANFTELTEITIPSTVKTIDEKAFYGCTSLKKVINKSKFLYLVKGESTHGYVAYYATVLETILKPYGENLVWSLDDAGVLKIEGSGDMQYYNSFEQPWYSLRDKILALNIADTVTSISDDAFYGCCNLTEINIPDNIKSIGSSAFSYCTELTKATIGDNVTSIGKYAFNMCDKLAEITIPSSVTSIDNDTFYGCDDNIIFRVEENSYAHTFASTRGYKIFLTLVNPPLTPILADKTDTSVILTPVDGYQYKINNEEWQNDNIFNDLSPETEYYFYQRIAETQTSVASESSIALSVKTDKLIIVGDANRDGQVTTDDLNALRKTLLEIKTFSLSQIKIYDVNNNGKVNIGDLLRLKKIISNLN